MRVWCAHSGVGRAKSYEMLAQKELRGVKHGRSLLIDIEHGLAYLRSLPLAEIRPRSKPRKRSTPLTGPITPEIVARIVHAGNAEQPAERKKEPAVKRAKRAR
jgi:hypothetical protein